MISHRIRSIIAGAACAVFFGMAFGSCIPGFPFPPRATDAPIKPEGDGSAVITTMDPAALTEAPSAAPTEASAAFGLRINELVNGDEGWAELINDSDSAEELSRYCVSDSADKPEKFRLPVMELAPGATVVVELTGEGGSALAAPFKLGKSEDALYLFGEAGEPVDKLVFDPSMPEGISAVRAEDGTAYTSHITKGEPNSETTFGAIEWTPLDPSEGRCLFISEVIADNKYGIVDSFGDRSDWVELLNPTDGPVYLTNYYLSDNPAEPLKYRLPNVALMPHSYAVIFLSGRESGDHDGEIHVPFKLSPGESIVLSSLDGMKYDILDIPEDISPNVSVGRNSSYEIRYYGAPTPGAENSTHGLEKYADAGGFDAASVYISEVCAVTPARGGADDWVELHNGSSSKLDITGWRLTDDFEEPDKYVFSGSIKAGGYIVVTCRDGRSGSHTAPFSVSNTGDTLYLIDSEGAVRDVFETGVTELGMTSGRAADSVDGERLFFGKATKGVKNGAPLSGMAAEPVFSVTELFHSSPFKLSLSSSTPGAEIRYTTDGSLPSSSSKLYSEPITISKNTVITARAFREGYAASPAAVSTYVMGEERSLPVVCLSMSKADHSRMYTASVNEHGSVTKGDEVPCRMEYYVNGRLALSLGAGVRVSGASTALYPQKSLGLYFRAGYGRSRVDYPFFGSGYITGFRSLTLRNSGQDAYGAHIRDAFISRICSGLKVDVSAVQPVVVYVNGEYRGVYDLKENMNEDFVAAHHGVDRDTVEICRRNGYMIAGTRERWNEMFTMCKTLDFSKKENFDKLKKLVDVDCAMDYLIARTYFYDWDMFNQKYWHTTDNSVKWRPVLYDSDYALSGNSVSGSNLSKYFDPNGVASAHGYITEMSLFCALNQNAEWRDRFITRYIYVVKYRFNKDKALKAFDKLVAEYKPEMRDQIKKWHMPASYEGWQSEVSALRSCIENRPAYALRILRNFYGLSESRFAEYERAADALAGG